MILKKKKWKWYNWTSVIVAIIFTACLMGYYAYGMMHMDYYYQIDKDVLIKGSAYNKLHQWYGDHYGEEFSGCINAETEYYRDANGVERRLYLINNITGLHTSGNMMMVSQPDEDYDLCDSNGLLHSHTQGYRDRNNVTLDNEDNWQCSFSSADRSIYASRFMYGYNQGYKTPRIDMIMCGQGSFVYMIGMDYNSTYAQDDYFLNYTSKWNISSSEQEKLKWDFKTWGLREHYVHTDKDDWTFCHISGVFSMFTMCPESSNWDYSGAVVPKKPIRIRIVR